jgi:hypothetical protein
MASLFDTGIRPVIDQYLKDKAQEKRDYGKYWSASSAGYCHRKLIFERLGVPPVTEDARKTRVFESGRIFHQWLQDITKKAGLSIAQELELQDEELMIRGHFDDLVLVKLSIPAARSDVPMTPDNPFQLGTIETDHLILYDYKTAHSKWFEYVKDRPMSHYNRMQLGTYMYMLRQKNWLAKRATKFDLEPKHAPANTKDLTEARILKVSKDDLRLHEQQLLWSPELEKEVYSYWSTLNGYWAAKKIPACTCAKFEINKKTGGGFMADPKYNPYYYQGEPCSITWYKKWKEENGNPETQQV